MLLPLSSRYGLNVLGEREKALRVSFRGGMTAFLAIFDVTRPQIPGFQGRVTAFSSKSDVTARVLRGYDCIFGCF